MSMYSIGDPTAVAAAFMPSAIQSYIQKHTQVELEGKLTRGLTVVDWFENGGHMTEGRAKTKIVCSIDYY